MLRVAVFVPLVVPALISRLVGFNEQVICAEVEVGEQVRFTVPVKPFKAVTVRVEVPVPPGAETVELTPLTEKSGEGVTPSHAEIRLATFSEPRPVTWSYPGPALKPIVVVPLGQFVLPLVQGTWLLPEVMSWNALFALFFAARLYNMGLMFPRPLDFVASLIKARIPANVGAPAEVPPTAAKLFFESRKPFVQSPGPQVK